MIPWSYEDKPVVSHPENAKAFVYLIRFADETYYIGMKSLYSTRRKKVPGKTRRVVTTVESAWIHYLSSSTLVKDKIKAGDRLVKREILQWCDTVACAAYHEARLQFEYGVLCDPLALNKWINIKARGCYKSGVT